MIWFADIKENIHRSLRWNKSSGRVLKLICTGSAASAHHLSGTLDAKLVHQRNSSNWLISSQLLLVGG